MMKRWLVAAALRRKWSILTIKHNVVAMHHGKHITQWHKDLAGGSSTEGNGSRVSDGTIVVSMAQSLFCLPRQPVLVGQSGSGDRRSVVTSPPDQHHPQFRHLPKEARFLNVCCLFQHFCQTVFLC